MELPVIFLGIVLIKCIKDEMDFWRRSQRKTRIDKMISERIK